MEPWIALAVFIVTYAAIATDRVDRTIAALLGATAMIAIGIIDQETGFSAVDWNVIFLLAGMMIIAAVLRRTGVLGCLLGNSLHTLAMPAAGVAPFHWKFS